MDEHRLGLKPLVDVWVQKQPIAQVNWRFVAMAVWLCSPLGGIGGFCPKLISTCSIGYWQTLPNILALEQAKSFWRWIKPVGIQVRKEVPEGIHLEFMPPPELQPAERLGL